MDRRDFLTATATVVATAALAGCGGSGGGGITGGLEIAARYTGSLASKRVIPYAGRLVYTQ